MPSSDLANCEITLYTCIIAIVTYATKNNSYCNTDTSVQALKAKRAFLNVRKYNCFETELQTCFFWECGADKQFDLI